MEGRTAGVLAAMAVGIAVGGGAGLFAGSAEAQSFNCRYARLPTEVAICQDETLSVMDEEMARIYSELLTYAPGWAARAIRGEQRDWLKVRNACGYNPQCIMGEYRYRIQELGAWGDRIG